MIYSTRELNKKEIILKLERHCSFSEKCKSDIIKKLYDWKIFNNHNEIINHLITNNYINEERYALQYCRGKFNSRSWGKIKIGNHLHQKGIDKNIILKIFSEIEDSDYIKKISDLILNKSKAIKEKDIFKRKSKIAKFLYQKGFETELIWQQIEKNLKND